MPKVYIINTNKSNNPKENPNDEKNMLSEEKCAAYFEPWKYKIDLIEPNDLVFLYSNENGIIARGVATGIVEIADHVYNNINYENEEHYMHLNRFQVFKNNPLPASKVSELVEFSVVWGQTMISLDYEVGLKVWQYITKHHIS